MLSEFSRKQLRFVRLKTTTSVNNDAIMLLLLLLKSSICTNSKSNFSLIMDMIGIITRWWCVTTNWSSYGLHYMVVNMFILIAAFHLDLRSHFYV